MKQRLSGTLGLYVEPRQTEGRGVDSGYSVVQNGTLQEAMHKLKITENGIAVARFGSRYSVHVPTKQAEPIHVQISPEIPFLSQTLRSARLTRSDPFCMVHRSLGYSLCSKPWVGRRIRYNPAKRTH
jgi:hypothetical protein